MYETTRGVSRPTLGATNEGTLGFSVPSWLTNIVGAVVRGKEAIVPTPMGNQVIQLDNPNEIAALFNMLKNTRVVNTPIPSKPTPTGAPSFVDKVPGGWLTIIGIGLVGAVVLFKRSR